MNVSNDQGTLNLSSPIAVRMHKSSRPEGRLRVQWYLVAYCQARSQETTHAPSRATYGFMLITLPPRCSIAAARMLEMYTWPGT